MTPESEPEIGQDPRVDPAAGVELTTPPQGLRTHPLSGLLNGLLWGAGVGAVFSIQEFIDGQWITGLGVLAIGFVLGMLAGLTRWWFTRYFIDESEIRVETGPIFHSSRRVTFERIQSVDIDEPFVARIMGLAELRIETAGGADSHTNLRFLQLQECGRLRALILDRAHGAESGASAPVDDNSDRRSLITTVAPARLMIGSLLSLDLMFLILSTLVAVVVLATFSFAAIGGLVPLFWGTAALVGSRVIGQWDFTLSRGDRGLRITRGLLSRSSQTIPFDRVQGILVVEPFIWRRFGWVRLEVDVAGYGVASSEGGVSSTTLLPISDRNLAQALIEELIPDPRASEAAVHRVSRRARVFAPIGWRHRWLSQSPDTVRCGTGWITRKTSIVPHHKVQSIDAADGPLLRWRGVATLAVHTPDGPVNLQVRHLNHELVGPVTIAELQSAREARNRHALTLRDRDGATPAASVPDHGGADEV